jgi:hypothetical protein
MTERNFVGDSESNEVDFLQEAQTISLQIFNARRTFDESPISAFRIPY